jgi:large subunit ribosomal protein L25
MHFDLFRVDEHQDIKISIPVHFTNQDIAPGIKRGGTLNIAFHELEVLVAADHIPEEIVVDLKGKNIGDAVHVSDLKLPKGAKATAAADVVVATVVGTSAQASEDAAADAAVAADQHAESEAEVQAAEAEASEEAAGD